MKLIQLLLICLSFTCSIDATAQDIITMKDSSRIKAKVEKVTPTDITYRRAVDSTGPEIVVYRQDVESITYANGEKDMMANGTYVIPASRGHKHSWAGPVNKHYIYGRTILSLAFLQATEESTSGDGGAVYPGFGFQYEYMLTPKQNISLYFPVTMSLYSVYDENTDYPYGSQHTHAFFYLYPGVKFYPMGSERKISYSIGPSVALGFGRKYYSDNYYYDSAGVYTQTAISKNVFKAGLMLNNGLTFMPSEHLCFGIELGLGFTVYSNDNINGYGSGPVSSNNAGSLIAQFNMKVGYRF